VSFVGSLRLDQEAAVAGLLTHDAGVLCAPAAFGKTDTAAAMMARRSVNTLVLVHHTEWLEQWQGRLQAFLGIAKGMVGTIGGGKAKPIGKIDIAVMQPLFREGEVNPLVEDYGQVTVDECHHAGRAARHAGPRDAGVLEGDAAAVRWTPAPRARQQDRGADHRFRGHRPPCAAEDVGQVAARLPRDGVQGQFLCARRVMTRSPESVSIPFQWTIKRLH
jgi:hypothetical protein